MGVLLDHHREVFQLLDLVGMAEREVQLLDEPVSLGRGRPAIGRVADVDISSVYPQASDVLVETSNPDVNDVAGMGESVFQHRRVFSRLVFLHEAPTIVLAH